MYCLWLPQSILGCQAPSSDDCSLQDFEDRLEAFCQAAPEHIAFFRSNPELFAACSCKGEVIVFVAFSQCSTSDPQVVVWSVRCSCDTAMRPCSAGCGAHCQIQIKLCVFPYLLPAVIEQCNQACLPFVHSYTPPSMNSWVCQRGGYKA